MPVESGASLHLTIILLPVEYRASVAQGSAFLGCQNTPPRLTIIKSDQEDSLNHVVDVELLTELLLGAEGAANLSQRVVAIIQTF